MKRNITSLLTYARFRIAPFLSKKDSSLKRECLGVRTSGGRKGKEKVGGKSDECTLYLCIIVMYLSPRTKTLVSV
jgi:D-tyrosyl-tRNA(Tyr) deacylase